jgi:hypothetical protein
MTGAAWQVRRPRRPPADHAGVTGTAGTARREIVLAVVLPGAPSAAAALSWWRVHRRTGLAVALWCALIIASTVLIHQHYLAGGLAVAGLALAADDRDAFM